MLSRAAGIPKRAPSAAKRRSHAMATAMAPPMQNPNTMATVGFGEVHPMSTAGRLWTVFVIFAGVGTFVGVVESVAESVFALKEERTKREKRNMIRGLFFSDVGLDLLGRVVRADGGSDQLFGKLSVDASWTPQRFRQAEELLEAHPFSLEADRLDLESMRLLLREKSDLLLRLLENPSVVEAEAFTDTLRAIFHLRDELAARPHDLDALPEADRRHLAGDVQRVYGLLAGQWLLYVEYLGASYPYLFSLAARTNPFKPGASAVVSG